MRLVKRYLIIIIYVPFLNIFSQKEVYFNITQFKDIKVESLQGIETRFLLIPSEYQSGFLSFPRFLYPSVYIGYFNERRIADCWTLNSTIGLKYIATKNPIWQAQYDSINGNYATGSGIKNTFEMNLDLGIEPRWYWGYKKKYQLGISDLNSGWYLSIPILFQTTLLNTPEPVLNLGWIPNYFQAKVNCTPTLGYRQAISKRWFLEGNFGLGVQVIFGVFSNNNIYNNGFFILNPTIQPHGEIKAAYTFK